MFDTFTELVSTTPYKIRSQKQWRMENGEWVWNVGGFEFDHFAQLQHSRLGNDGLRFGYFRQK
jgi:hypothetical protein